MARTSGEAPFGKAAAFRRVIKRNRITTVLAAAFLLALLYGSVLISQADANLQEKLSFLTQEYSVQRGAQSLLTTFLSSFSLSFVYLAAAFFLGFFAFGQPVSVFIILFRGFVLGLAMGQIYLNHQWQGVLYCAVLVVPFSVTFAFVLIAALKDSIQSSNLFLGTMFPKLGGGATELTLKMYAVRYAFYLLFIILTSALDAGLNFFFAETLAL